MIDSASNPHTFEIFIIAFSFVTFFLVNLYQYPSEKRMQSHWASLSANISAFFFQFICCIYQLRHPDGSLLLLLLLLPFQVSRQVQLLHRGIPIYSYRHAFEATPLPFIKNTATSKNEDNFIVSDFTSNPPYIVFVIIHGCIQLKSNIKIFLYWGITTKTRIIICRRNASSLIA